MASRSERQIVGRRQQEQFAERYPDYPSWLDGDTWELDIETEIHEPLANFRASLYYQARIFGSRLATKQEKTADGRKILLVRAYED